MNKFDISFDIQGLFWNLSVLEGYPQEELAAEALQLEKLLHELARLYARAVEKEAA